MVTYKHIYSERARELCNNDEFINLVNKYPDEFFNFGYHKLFKRLQNPNEFLALISEYQREKKLLENVIMISGLKPTELSEFILWVFNRQEAKVRKQETLEADVEATVKNLRNSPNLHRARKKDSENRSSSYGIFEKE